ncbi:MAG: biotin--[acetyl-CoA-carboxylase] ligase [Lishizhenia sp.]
MFKTEIGHKIIHLERVDSTNNYVANLVKEKNLEHGTVILADMQTNGRGQRGNTWQSDPFANLTMSVYVTPKHLNQANHLVLNHCVSLALKSWLEEKLKHVNIKWPNDILIGKKKIAGVLIENNWQGNQLKHSILGIGINVNQDQFTHEKSTSIFLESGLRTTPRLLALEFCAVLEDYFKQLNTNTIPFLKKQYDEQLWLKNVKTEFITKQKERFSGKIRGTNDQGDLIIETQTNTLTFSNGEIQFLERL